MWRDSLKDVMIADCRQEGCLCLRILTSERSHLSSTSWFRRFSYLHYYLFVFVPLCLVLSPQFFPFDFRFLFRYLFLRYSFFGLHYCSHFHCLLFCSILRRISLVSFRLVCWISMFHFDCVLLLHF